MRPGEVQRWRLLNATDGDNLLVTLVSKDAGEQGLGLNVAAMDAITWDRPAAPPAIVLRGSAPSARP